jgi:DNA-3-methyladenine glycosylase
MFGPPAHVYVYRSYGLHWCLNLVCEPEGRGAAVLLRALAPEVGLEAMRARRGHVADRLLCAGLGRLCQALGVDASMNGAPLEGGPLSVLPREEDVDVVVGPRIGISRDVDRPWRFGVRGSPHLSRPFPRTAAAA